MINVFTDLHHWDLYFALHLLFEKRLQFNLYRPIGMEWFHEGFWKIAEPYNNAIDTVIQYLDINNTGFDTERNLNGSNYADNDIYYVYDPFHKYYQKAITLDKFKSMKFDIILPSYPTHDFPYEELTKKYQPKASTIFHCGNGGSKTDLKYVISSAPYDKKDHQDVVFAHQELDENIYRCLPVNTDTKNIYSIVNCHPCADVYNQYRSLLSEANFKAYGAGCPDGALKGVKEVCEKMAEANIGWQIKPFGGMGHTALGWFACGRPTVTDMSMNLENDKDAPLFFEDGVTCLDINAHTPEENCKIIRRMLEPEENIRMAENAYQRYKDICNYDKEEQDVRNLLERALNE